MHIASCICPFVFLFFLLLLLFRHKLLQTISQKLPNRFGHFWHHKTGLKKEKCRKEHHNRIANINGLYRKNKRQFLHWLNMGYVDMLQGLHRDPPFRTQREHFFENDKNYPSWWELSDLTKTIRFDKNYPSWQHLSDLTKIIRVDKIYPSWQHLSDLTKIIRVGKIYPSWQLYPILRNQSNLSFNCCPCATLCTGIPIASM